MTVEMWIIAVTRVAGSLPVLRWPFYGAILAIVVDQSDVLLMNLLDFGGVGNYQTFDKYVDQVYIGCFLAVALRWQGVDRNVAVALYVYRMAGFLVFEATQSRDILLLFPNLFEFWFVFVAAKLQFGWQEALQGRRLAIVLTAPHRPEVTSGVRHSLRALAGQLHHGRSRRGRLELPHPLLRRHELLEAYYRSRTRMSAGGANWLARRSLKR